MKSFCVFVFTFLTAITGLARGISNQAALQFSEAKNKNTDSILNNSRKPNADEGYKTFSFHLNKEPSTLKPWEQAANSNFFFSLTNGTLLKYQDKKIQPYLAEKCIYVNNLKIRCQLRSQLYWSDGSTPITSDDFVRAFKMFVDPKSNNAKSPFLFPILNAKKIFLNELPVDQLGVRAINKTILEIDLENSDSDFLYTLAHPILSPIPASKIASIEEIKKKPDLHLSSGPYRIQNWSHANKIHLEPNAWFWQKNKRPHIDVWFIPEDTVAIQLYEKKDLSMVRNLSTVYFDKYKDRADFFEIPQFRFDYIGFSPKFDKLNEFKKIMGQALNYFELKKLFSAKGMPGCPGFIDENENKNLCVTYNLSEAQKKWLTFDKAKLPSNNLTLVYSRLGGDNHQNGLEWMQNQWKSNLGLNISVAGIENQTFIEKIKKGEADIFRKGINLDRPTCVSALENFTSNAPENYIRFNNKNYDTLIAQLKKSKSKNKSQSLCFKALTLLLDETGIIPTGPIYFAMLVQPQWKNWKLNELNQLDLSQLEWKP